MRPRIPTSSEIRLLKDQLPSFQAEENKEHAKELYELAYSSHAFGSSVGEPTDEGYRRTYGGRYTEYAEHRHDGEVYEYGFSTLMSELSERLPIDNLDTRKQWQGIPVTINMRVTHKNTGATTRFPVARLSTDKAEWAITDENGETQWHELDIFSEGDQEPLAILKDTLDFIQQERN